MSENIAGKVVIITGASSGLGEATARHLARDGAKLVLAARRIDKLRVLVADIEQAGGAAIAVEADVVSYPQMQNVAKVALDHFGRIDVLLNNAGIMPNSPIERLQVDDWSRAIDINIKGVLHGIAAVLPTMQEQKAGHIINVSSIAGHKALPGSAVYCGTKFAVRAISESMRQEVKPYNIRTTIISPGAVDTELLGSVTQADVAAGMKKFYDTVAIPADSFARVVAFAISQPADVDINEILFRPTAQTM